MIKNYNERKTDEFVDKIESMLRDLGVQCDYEIIEHEDGTRYALIKDSRCIDEIVKKCKDYALNYEITEEGLYLIDVPP